jgi:hypothetical protein
MIQTTPYNCVPTAVFNLLESLGYPLQELDLEKLSGTLKCDEDGTDIQNAFDFLKKIGLKPKNNWEHGIVLDQVKYLIISYGKQGEEHACYAERIGNRLVVYNFVPLDLLKHDTNRYCENKREVSLSLFMDNLTEIIALE